MVPIKCKQTFNCELCDNRFSCKRNLNVHLNSLHLLNYKSYKCLKCEFVTSYQSSLKRHEKRIHKNEDSAVKYFKCSKCTSQFKDEAGLKRHQKRKHNLRPATFTKRKCPMCPFVSIKNTTCEIYNHFKKIHDVPIRKEKYNFNTVEEFYSWKKDIEKETSTSYVIKGSFNTATYFRCHRSGYHTRIGHKKRHTKMTGSCKINAFCPAGIKMLIKSNTVEVVYVPNHIGHKNELKHLRFSKDERKSIALQIANKIPHREIIKNIRCSILNHEIQRIHLITNKDIVNIQNSFNLHEDSTKHQFDPISVTSWVKELSNSDNVALVLYKPQGVEDPTLPDLKSDDFLLIFMTEAQKNMLLKHGHDTICIDGTHGLNNYDFQLYTLLVLDDTREGFPAAFMFTNRGDECTISKFICEIKTVTGCISPNVFMSDMEEAFFSAWKKHMGMPKLRLFCSWHVLRAWRGNIIRKIKIKEKRDFVEGILRTLMFELDVETFKTLLSGAFKLFSESEDLKEFSEYFETYYVTNERFITWAYCFRAHAGINTNMSLENFNRVLKYCYLKGKRNRRLDKTLYAILNLLRDKLFDLLIKLKKGKLVQKLKILRKNHKNSFTIQLEQITKCEESWKVLSSKNDVFVIKKIKDCNSCQLRCQHCDSCFHEYICSCLDSCIKNNMCKHIHAVAKSEIKESDVHKDINDLKTLEIDCDLNEIAEEDMVVSQLSQNNLTVENMKSSITQSWDYLLNSNSFDQISYLYNETTRIRTTIEAMNMPTTSEQILKVQENVPNNSNIISQRKFVTKKKKKKNVKNNVTLHRGLLLELADTQ